MTDPLHQEIEALQALLGSPRDPDGRAFAPLADAYRRAGSFRQAVEVLRQGMERLPDFLPGHVVAAQLYLEKGLLEEAELASRRAVELDGENEMALGLLADVLDAQGKAGEAAGLREGLGGGGDGEAPLDEEPVMDLDALAPEPTAEEADEEPVMDLDALAPEPAAAEADEEPVMDLEALAPGPAAEAVDEEPVMELEALAPEPAAEAVDEEPVMDLEALAPEPAAEEAVDEEPVMDLETLAPEPAAEEAADDPEDLPSDELDDEPVMTRTMAELYARQGLTDRALEVFRHLLQASPGDASLRARVEALSGMVSEAADEEDEDEPQWMGGAPDDDVEADTPFAWTGGGEADEEVETGPAISTYFGRMLGWEPTEEETGGEAEG